LPALEKRNNIPWTKYMLKENHKAQKTAFQKETNGKGAGRDVTKRAGEQKYVHNNMTPHWWFISL